mgnify:CR=1 FL=1
MNIGILPALILLGILGWLPVIVVFLITIFIYVNINISIKTNLKKMSKIYYIAGVIFVPVEIIFMRFFIYSGNQAKPPNWIILLFAILGFLLFIGKGKSYRKKSENVKQD